MKRAPQNPALADSLSDQREAYLARKRHAARLAASGFDEQKLDALHDREHASQGILAGEWASDVRKDTAEEAPSVADARAELGVLYRGPVTAPQLVLPDFPVTMGYIYGNGRGLFGTGRCGLCRWGG